MGCKSVVIIEDDQAVREMLQDVLELEGYKTHAASDGREGFELLDSMVERPCAIILDMMMPKINGWQFLDRQRFDSELSQIPIIVCSAYPETVKAIRDVIVIEKPVKLPVLTEAIRTACA